MSSICFTVFGDCLAETCRATIIIFLPFPVRVPHYVGDRVFIVRILSEHGTRCCGEETQIREADYRVVDSMGED